MVEVGFARIGEVEPCPAMEGHVLEVLPERGPRGMQDAPETFEQYSACALWQDEWNGRRHAEMRVFISMKIRHKEPEVKSRWRIQFHSMGNGTGVSFCGLWNTPIRRSSTPQQ